MRALAVLTLTVGGLLLGVRTLRFTAPFLCAKALAMAMEPSVAWLARRRFPRKVGACIALLLLTGTAGVALFSSSIRRWGRGLALVQRLPEIWPGCRASWSAGWTPLSSGVNLLPADLTAVIQQALRSLLGTLDSWVAEVAQGAWRTAAALPETMAFFMFTLMGAYFFCADRGDHRRFSASAAASPLAAGHAPPAHRAVPSDLWVHQGAADHPWDRSDHPVGRLMILRVDYALALAGIIALGDALPFLGSGAFLLPWALVSWLGGNRYLALGLVLVYGVVFLTREGLEPHLVGGRIGLHPLVTMISMFAGLKLWGFLGMIFGPVCLFAFALCPGVLYKGAYPVPAVDSAAPQSRRRRTNTMIKWPNLPGDIRVKRLAPPSVRPVPVVMDTGHLQ